MQLDLDTLESATPTLVEPGEYTVTIAHASEKKTKKGQDMLVIGFEVDTQNLEPTERIFMNLCKPDREISPKGYVMQSEQLYGFIKAFDLELDDGELLVETLIGLETTVGVIVEYDDFRKKQQNSIVFLSREAEED